METKQIKDYYSVLSVPETASKDEILKAFQRESINWHPDRNESSDSLENFQLATQAYYVLSDKDRKAAYDQNRTSFNELTVQLQPNEVFVDAFDELIIPEVPNPKAFWQIIGSVAGFILGLIILNVPGAIIGAYLGNKLGKVRDMKGVCVYEAFMNLERDKRIRILTNLAKKFLK
ncbi:hypothetical protein HK096_005487 [Nowakowskiella sp. JEL0078]|nr:hypothetical protein HK096_005487 [Nowakowskiella sp. JEL0078]